MGSLYWGIAAQAVIPLLYVFQKNNGTAYFMKIYKSDGTSMGLGLCQAQKN